MVASPVSGPSVRATWECCLTHGLPHRPLTTRRRPDRVSPGVGRRVNSRGGPLPIRRAGRGVADVAILELVERDGRLETRFPCGRGPEGIPASSVGGGFARPRAGPGRWLPAGTSSTEA